MYLLVIGSGKICRYFSERHRCWKSAGHLLHQA